MEEITVFDGNKETRARTVAIGVQDFETLIQNDCFYVDKTGFIKEWWESRDAVTLIARPRRFGKTLNMNMLERIFSIQYEGQGDVFEHLSIWKEEKYRKLQGTYPVLFLSLADIKESNLEDAIESIKSNIVSLYNQNRFLLEEGFLNPVEQEQFESVTMHMSDVVAAKSIRFLCSYLNKYYQKKVIVLLDEYDTPLQEAYIKGYWDGMVSFTRSLFNNTFKTNPYLERAVMTGITRVSNTSYEVSESMFSDLNNLKVVTMTSDNYASYFGFTEAEVFAAMDEFNLTNRDEVRHWYDGFTIGNLRDMYNPWSIICFLDEKVLRSYWANTSSNGLLSSLIQQGTIEIKEIMENLIQGDSLFAEIDEEVVFSQLNTKKNAIWSLMLASGYLKVLNSEFTNHGTFCYELGITNFEVQVMLRNMIHDWFNNMGNHYNDFIKALLQNDKKAMNYYMNKVVMQTISYFDTGNKPSDEIEPERFYHGFVLGLMVDLSDQYHILSNRESGFGRYDVMLEPIETKQAAYVLEFKVYDSEDEQGLQDTVQSALEQIQTKQYDSNLLAKGISPEQIFHYGFAFRGKEVLIG